jgi:hypothetical protein
VKERRFAIRLTIAQGFLLAAETTAIHHIGAGLPSSACLPDRLSINCAARHTSISGYRTAKV